MKDCFKIIVPTEPHSHLVHLSILRLLHLHFIYNFALCFGYADILLMKVINFKAVCQLDKPGIEALKDKLILY